MRDFYAVVALLLLTPALCRAQVANKPEPAAPSSNGYKPYALSLEALISEGSPISKAIIQYATTGDSSAIRKFVESQAAGNDLAAQLLLGEQYIPERCPQEPDRDSPNCGKMGNVKPAVTFRKNPLGIPASYESAAQWLERASAQGSGEATEILAQLVTRMLTNGHATTYNATDSTRLHALARSQGFDLEDLQVICYTLEPTTDGKLQVKRDTSSSLDPNYHFADMSSSELETLRAAGVTGLLRADGGSGSSSSVLLMRPEGPPVRALVIVSGNVTKNIHLQLPSHQSVLYVQHGDTFLALPSGVHSLGPTLSLVPPSDGNSDMMIYMQNVSGEFGGSGCGSFRISK